MPKSWLLKTPQGEYLRLSYNGATTEMEPSLIPSRYEGPFCYAAEWHTKAGAERNRTKYTVQFPTLVAVKE